MSGYVPVFVQAAIDDAKKHSVNDIIEARRNEAEALFREQTARDFLVALVNKTGSEGDVSDFVRLSVDLTDALIRELKK